MIEKNFQNIQPQNQNISLKWGSLGFVICVSSLIETIICLYFDGKQNGLIFHIILGLFLLQILLFCILGFKKRFKKTIEVQKYIGIIGLVHSLFLAILASKYISKTLALQLITFCVIFVLDVLIILLLEVFSRKKSEITKNKKVANEESKKKKRFFPVIDFVVILVIILMIKRFGVIEAFLNVFLPVLSLCYSLFYAAIINYKTQLRNKK